MNSLSDPSSKILHHPDRLADFKRGLAFPISAEIDLTWRCALNCKGCHSKWLHSGVELQPEQIKRILTELHSKGLQSVTWSGGGDPLESPHWQFAMNLAYDLGLDQGLYSYLPGLGQELVDFIESKRLCFVYTHSNKPKWWLKHSPASRTVWTYGWLLDSENWNRIPEMIAKSNLDFYNFVDFRPLAPENKPDAPMELDYSWIRDALRVLDAMQKFNPQVKFAKYKFDDLLKPGAKRGYSKCFSTDFTASVGPNGDMYECLNRRGFSESILGNLLVEDLETIWQRKARFREDLSQCRILCRGHEMNKTLYKIFGEEIQHSSFV